MADNDGGTGVFAVSSRPGQLNAEDGNYTAAENRAEDRGNHDHAECTAVLCGVAAARCWTFNAPVSYQPLVQR